MSVLAFVAVAAAGTAQADPFTWLGPTSLIATGGSRALPTVSCPSTTQCTTADAVGEQITFNPSTGAIASHSAVDTGLTISSLSCVSTTQCVGVDNGGNATAFDPITGALIGAGHASLGSVDQLTGVSCVSGTNCTAVDHSGKEVSFNPNSGAFSGVDRHRRLDTTDRRLVPDQLARGAVHRCRQHRP